MRAEGVRDPAARRRLTILARGDCAMMRNTLDANGKTEITSCGGVLLRHPGLQDSPRRELAERRVNVLVPRYRGPSTGYAAWQGAGKRVPYANRLDTSAAATHYARAAHDDDTDADDRGHRGLA